MRCGFAICHKLSIFCKLFSLFTVIVLLIYIPIITVFELPVTLVMFVGEAVHQKLLADCLLELPQMCSEHKSKSSIMILSYKFAEISFALNVKTGLQI